jgi:dTDP-4-dehydrorhamnose 3,5-epimerase
MHFSEAGLSGAWLITPAPVADERGYFARTFCEREYAEHGLETRFVQHSTSFSAKKGTLRGMHFQLAPHSETKVVSCLKGAVFDVIVDLRSTSPTFRQWRGFELTAENRRQLYIPRGFAHGFQTLGDDAEIAYLISEFHTPAAASGIRHDDPAFAIAWPGPVTVISQRDRSWPDFTTSPF